MVRTIFAVPASLLMALTIASGPAHSEDQGAVAERFFRELRVDRIWEGTSEIQRLIIARNLLKRGLDNM